MSATLAFNELRVSHIYCKLQKCTEVFCLQGGVLQKKLFRKLSQFYVSVGLYYGEGGSSTLRRRKRKDVYVGRVSVAPEILEEGPGEQILENLFICNMTSSETAFCVFHVLLLLNFSWRWILVKTNLCYTNTLTHPVSRMHTHTKTYTDNRYDPGMIIAKHLGRL